MLFGAPWGLRPPGAPAAAREAGTTSSCGTTPAAGRSCFRASTRRASTVAIGSRSTARLPRLPWEYEILDGDGSEARVRFSDTVPADPVPASSASSDCAMDEPELLVEGAVRNESTRDRAVRLGSSLCRRAAVSRAGLPAGDPRSDDRHVTRALGARDGTARAGSSGAVAVGDRCGPEGRSTFATFPARRRGATTISTSPTSTRGGSRCRTRGSS